VESRAGWFGWTIVDRGGPGSGNWGHKGRKGQRGGSLAKSGGAAFALYKYLKKKKAALSTPAAKAVIDGIKAQKPDATDRDIDMYLGVMEMDKEKFDYYGQKLGLDVDKLRDPFFAEMGEAEKTMERLKMQVQDNATYQWTGTSGKKFVAINQETPGDLYEKVEGKVGATSADTIETLKGQGIKVSVQGNVPEERLHRELSQLSNLLQEKPMLQKIFAAQGGRVEYRERPEYKPTAAASWDHDKIVVWHKEGDYPNFPNVWAHEIGHALEKTTTVTETSKIFGKGRHVSAYAWTNFQEDFAETFTSVIFGDKKAMDFAGPEKTGFINDLLAGVQ